MYDPHSKKKKLLQRTSDVSFSIGYVMLRLTECVFAKKEKQVSPLCAKATGHYCI